MYIHLSRGCFSSGMWCPKHGQCHHWSKWRRRASYGEQGPRVGGRCWGSSASPQQCPRYSPSARARSGRGPPTQPRVRHKSIFHINKRRNPRPATKCELKAQEQKLRPPISFNLTSLGLPNIKHQMYMYVHRYIFTIWSNWKQARL
jgi:hypothetical protein